MPRPPLRFALALLLPWASAVAAPPDELAVHRLGDVPFRTCALSTRGLPNTLDAFCATVEVPLDHANPSGPKIQLAVAWLKASEKASAAKDLAVLLAGGPGQGSREPGAMVGRVLHELRRHHHLLFIDQRGTGESTPLRCKEAEDHTETLDPEAQAKLLHGCRAKFPADPRFFTTADAVADLEFVRQRLGGPQLNLIGVSYGTRLAQEYARAHPQGVRTLVLDGVVPPSLVAGKDFGRSLDSALVRAVGGCQGLDAGCEPPLTVLDAALAQLRTPRTVTYDDPWTGESKTRSFGARELMQLIHAGAYQPLFISAFSQMFRDAQRGNLAPLAAQLRIVERSMGISPGLHFAVTCAEDAPQLTDADAEAESKTRMGRESLDTYRTVCRDWPRREAPAARLTPLTSDAPTLLLSGEWDPVTPPEGAELVAKSLSHARHLVLRGQGHNVLGVGCMPKVLARFIAAGKLDGLDAQCTEAVRPLRPFTSRTGWEP